jgi:hypothetical protein
MRHKLRIRRIAKWAGACLCVLIVGAWGMSLRWGVSFYHREWRVTIAASSVNTLVATSGPYFDHLERKYKSRGAEWFFYRIPLFFYSDYGLTWPHQVKCGTFGDATDTVIPLWLPLLPIVFTTAVLFYFDHHRGPRFGCCPQCGYNMTGNESGICPECGTSRRSSDAPII